MRSFLWMDWSNVWHASFEPERSSILRQKRTFASDAVRIGLLFLLLGLLLAGGFLLPPQYEETFLGELKYKYMRLHKTEGKRLILLGGSSVAFGVDSQLLAQEFPDYEIVNFGMYAGLGTTCMLSLSQDAIREGDLVLVIPEQQERTLSTYFDGTYFWQAADGAFSLLLNCGWENWGALGIAFPQFSFEKWKLFLTGTQLKPEDVYARASFDALGDIVSKEAFSNQMAGGYDVNVPILFDEKLATDAFVRHLNQYASQAQAKGADVWYHFCPMNEAAIEPRGITAEERDAQLCAYADSFQARLAFPIAGNVLDCVLEPEWFYDTNFHLNAAGKTVYTKLLAEDIKAMLGDESPTAIALPQMPQLSSGASGQQVADFSAKAEAGAKDFQWCESNGEIWMIGLSENGKEKRVLTVPAALEGFPVTRIASRCFSDGAVLEEVCVPESVTVIENGAFAGCACLKTIRLPWEQPGACMVGEGLLDGTNAVLAVPQQAVNAFKVNYTWSLYADRIKTGGLV